jgi:hypothetical protein
MRIPRRVGEGICRAGRAITEAPSFEGGGAPGLNYLSLTGTASPAM